MSARAERVKSFRTEHVVIGFDIEKLKAPFLLRCGAVLIDYIILISIPVIFILISRWYGEDGTQLFTNKFSNAGWLITILVGLTNLLIFPVLSGQTFGKMLTGLKVLKTDGKTPSFGSLLLRHLIGYPLTALTLGLGFLPAVFGQKGRALHDYLSGTVVVFGKKRVSKEEVK